MEQGAEINKRNKWNLKGCLKIMYLNYKMGETCPGPFPDPYILFIIGFIWHLSSASHLKASIIQNAERVAPDAQVRDPKPACSVMSLLTQFQTIQ